MHAYDVPRRQSYPPIPSPSSRLRSGREVPPARAPQDHHGGLSATPIYDALYAEFVKSYRTLPGDRSGEEDLGFVAFGNLPHDTGSTVYGAYSLGAYGTRHVTGRQQAQWQRVGTIGRQDTGMHHVPAALPPARRGGI
ncbi:hypothetical protein ACIOC2_28880 [Streptomyces sp. NPDC088337]|uniref:hypothetical protein n=1 Tax=unclassified Streptomyces TaxID=2593676 RepID=UPI002DD8A68E|nr:hypothetical protein [Streptomyces sp. NBC_01788]WSB26000.1 hypothetical protein OIE49_08925 [Streptomyces sp. NBC_01788]